MVNKIELNIPKITNEYPEPSEIKRFADSFTRSEWNKLCLDKQFCNLIITDLKKAKSRAECLLGKKVEISREEILANPS